MEPWEDPAGISHLEIQKLMYFANEADPDLALDFTPGRYGPYSERVRHLLQGMEGAFTVGLVTAPQEFCEPTDLVDY